MINLIAGNEVIIYEDPLTEKIPEGKAILIKHKRVYRSLRSGLEYWWVQFHGENKLCFRAIKFSKGNGNGTD